MTNTATTTATQTADGTLQSVTPASPAVNHLQTQVATVKAVATSNNNVIPTAWAPEIAILIGVSKVIRPLFGLKGQEIIDSIDADLDILSGLPVGD
jgi:hypothetical protein